MTKHGIVGAVVAFVGAAAVGAADRSVVVELRDAKGQSVGTAKASESKVVPAFRLRSTSRTCHPGERGIHIHQIAKCEAPAFHFGRPPLQS